MEPHIDIITLAVGDLDRSLAFYRDGLGLETPGVTGSELVGDEANAAGAVVMFHLRGGLVLAPPPRSPVGDLLRLLPRPDGHLWEIIWNPPSDNTAP